MTAAVYHHPACLRHEVPPGHPEGGDRVEAVLSGIRERLGEGFLRTPPVRPEGELLDAVARVHAAALPSRFRQATENLRRGYLDTPDCPFSPGSFDAALAAVSTALTAADDVLDRRVSRAFVAVRPPGHHARPDVAMGFCFFNTIATVAAHLVARGLERVLVLDWDVHHGNGTQEIFWSSDRVLFASLHRYPFYPGTGAADELGQGAGRGFTRNFPMRAGEGDREYRAIFEGELTDRVAAFRPEFVLVSAGFDPHEEDPLGGMRVTEEGFAEWTRSAVGWAEAFAGGRIVTLLEGGYDRPALARSAAEHVAVLAEGGFSRATGNDSAAGPVN